MKKCMFICMCLLSVQVTITMDNGKNNQANERIKVNKEAYKNMQVLFKQQRENKELERQKKEIENQLKNQTKEKKKLELKIENQKKPIYTNPARRKPNKRKMARCVAGRRRCPRTTRTSHC